jgi:hypothetical protein
MTLLAHSGHWLISLIYVAPVAVVVLGLGVQSLRDRHRDPAEADDPAPVEDDRW